MEWEKLKIYGNHASDFRLLNLCDIYICDESNPMKKRIECLNKFCEATGFSYPSTEFGINLFIHGESTTDWMTEVIDNENGD
jgi:hypothetical protein